MSLSHNSYALICIDPITGQGVEGVPLDDLANYMRPVGTRGTAVLDFGSTPGTTAAATITGLSGLSLSSRKEARCEFDDSTVDNTTTDHELLGFSGTFVCKYVSDTAMQVMCHLLLGMATGKFNIRWVVVP